MTTEVLIREGQVFDGTGGDPVGADVLLRGDVVAEIGPNLPTEERTLVDATGLLVCSGLVDPHAHVFTGMGIYSVDPDQAGLRAGVTALVDTGTAGALTYPTFRRLVIGQAKEDIYALLHISMNGCLFGHPGIDPVVGELSDPRFLDVPLAVDCIKRFADRILGTQVRLTGWLADNKIETERLGLRNALEAARQTGGFLMVHHVQALIPPAEWLDSLRSGDVLTYLYHPREHSPFEGKVRVANPRLVAVGVFKKGQYQTCQRTDFRRVKVPALDLTVK